MPLEPFNFAALRDFDDGRLPAAFDDALAACVSDCADRPGERKARKITVTVELVPVLRDGKTLDSCEIAFEVKHSAPPRQSIAYSLDVKGEELLYMPGSPEDHRQPVLYPPDKSKAKEARDAR